MSKEEVKIGIFLDSLGRITGGHKRRINIALELRKRGYDAVLLVRNFKKDPKWKGLELPPTEMTRLPLKKDFLFIGDHKYQLFPWLKGKGKKVWMFQGINQRLPSQVYREWRNPNVVRLTFTSWMKEKVEKLYGKAVLAPGGVDTKFFFPGKRKEKYLVGTRIHFAKYKNLVPQVEKVLKEYGWRFVEIRGDELEIRKQYQKAELAISLRGELEGGIIRDWNNPTAEAMATRTATIVMKSGGVRDIAEHKKTAYVLENKEEKTVIEAIRWMIENEKERKRIAENGYKRIQNFTYEKMIDIIEKEIIEKEITKEEEKN